MALDFAPLTVSIISQFFLPTQNGLIACSAAYPYISIICGTSHPSFYSRPEEFRNHRYF